MTEIVIEDPEGFRFERDGDKWFVVDKKNPEIIISRFYDDEVDATQFQRMEGGAVIRRIVSRDEQGRLVTEFSEVIGND